jgi:nicotinate phosphoribosyltransferase
MEPHVTFSPTDIALATDLYQLTMAAAYAAQGETGEAVFSLFVRRLPRNRSFLIAAGVDEALARLSAMRFDDGAIEYLRSTGQIREEFLKSLSELRFSGNVWAVPEGEVIFANEPIIEVHAPIIEAQLAETITLNALHYATAVATKAARCVLAAPSASIVDFGLRRTPGIEAGLTVARVTWMCGFDATSNVLAGRRLGMPISGTVAHSFIEIFPSEVDAFLAFGRGFPGPATLLIDTYDTLNGAQRAVDAARILAGEGRQVAAVRLDSGDLAELSRKVRAILDDAGLEHVKIVASGGLDEYALAELTAAAAPIDAYGVGTRVGTSADAPSLDMIYKLVEYDGRPALKLSPGKQTLIGPKQVWRRRDEDGRLAGDIIAMRDEGAPGDGWTPLLRPVMERGEVLERPSLTELRARHRAAVGGLPEALRDVATSAEYAVRISPLLQRRQRAAEEAVRSREGIASAGTATDA